ncbi:MFS transporter [Asanoa iriomotensis]|uniref:MFS transporter n=1 Tax=Asanoa iriomotensis TaxID=234613 RepID=A0ABQ4C4K7_9ACTN|nr:MFS transporter [Asanoa iriomotensis]GIF57723.1 MFS transporter [Asanoa iriomotensis]
MNFRLIWLGYSLSAFGDAVVPAALALAVIQATGSASALALVLACGSVPRLVLLPIGGVLADRWSPRTVAIVADVARAAVQIWIGVELVAGTFRLTDIAVAAAVSGAAAAFALPTGGPLVSATVPPEGRPRANGLLGVSRGAAGVLGPAVGGTLVLTVGSGWAFVVDAGTFVVSAIALALVRLHVPVARAAAAVVPMRRALAEGWRELGRHDWLWTTLIGHGIWNLSAAVLMTLGPLIAVHRAGGEAVWVAVTQAGAIGILAGSVLATRVGATGRFGINPRRPVLWANLALSAFSVPLLLFAVPASAPWLVAGYGLSMAGLGFLNPVWVSVVQQHVAPDRLARVNSWDMLISYSAMPLGYALAPLAATQFGGEAVPLVIAAILVAVSTAGTAVVPGVRNLTLFPKTSAPAADPTGAPTESPDPVPVAADVRHLTTPDPTTAQRTLRH